MVLHQPIHVVIQRVQAAGRGDARLTHRSGKHVLVPARLSNERRSPGQHGSDRRAEPLREVDPYRIGHRRESTGGDAGCGARVEQASAVHMDCHAQLA